MSSIISLNNVFDTCAESIIMDLKKQQIGLTDWNSTKPYYPEYLLLGTDKGILAYLDFFFHKSFDNINCELKRIVEETRLAHSDLDRPVFFVHVVENERQILFETDEQVKDRLFCDKSCYERIDNIDYYCVDVEKSGTYDELIELLKNIKFNKK